MCIHNVSTLFERTSLHTKSASRVPSVANLLVCYRAYFLHIIYKMSFKFDRGLYESPFSFTVSSQQGPKLIDS